LIAKANDKGELVKQTFGPAVQTVFKLLAPLKALRGTAFDLFGRTEERKTERALIGEYQASIDEVLSSLNAGNHATALEIASLPEQIRGYGHVRQASADTAGVERERLMQQFQQPVQEIRRAG
jgi:indolepyruvate ferredoxin oxidoreductase